MQEWEYAKPPPPRVNGGWYTGAQFPKGAPWRNFTVVPDVPFLNANLNSARPPPGAEQQYPGSYRPGNNAQSMPGVVKYNGPTDMLCTTPRAPSHVRRPPTSRFAMFSPCL